MEKSTNSTYKTTQEEKPKYTQHALFNFEESDLAISSLSTEADHILSQDSQSVDRDQENVISNKKHGEKSYFTPKEIINLIIELLNPQPETTIYDPCCGSGTSLVAVLHYLEKNHPGRKTTLFGQEPLSDLCAQARIALSHSSNTNINICEGIALQKPNWLGENSSVRRFDYVIATPPWNQEVPSKYFSLASHKERFEYGIPKRYADWGWIQHILASLSDQGRAVILTSMGAITRGIYSEGGSEQKIRIQLIQSNYVEAVIRLPDSLFTEVTFPCALLILNHQKPRERQNQILEIDASQLFTTTIGKQPKKKLTQEGINTIIDIYKCWETRNELSKIVTLPEAKAKRYNINPSVYTKTLPLPAPLDEILHKTGLIKVEHCHIYTEIATLLDNKHIADLALSGEFKTTISKIVSSQPPQDKLPGIIILRQHISHLQSIIQQEIIREEEYKHALMYGFFTNPIWSSERLGTITTVSSGKNLPSKDKKLYGNAFCWVQIQDLNNGKIKSTTKMLSQKGIFAITPKTKKNMKAAKDEDNIAVENLLNKIGTVLVAKINGCEHQGKLGILEVPAATNVEICCIEPRPDKFLPDYLLYYITYIRHTWADYASQTRREPRVPNNVISDTQVVFPPKDKQQEIVQYLQTIDNKIRLLKSEKDFLDVLVER